MKLYRWKKKIPIINTGKQAVFIMGKQIKVMLALLGLWMVATLLWSPKNLSVVTAASRLTMNLVDKENEAVVLKDGQRCVIINGAIVQVGDQGIGWSYESEDILQLTGGSAIRSILVTDDLNNPNHLIGSRRFTIEVIGANTITASTVDNKNIAIQYPGVGNNESGDNSESSITIPKDWGITVMGNLTITGKGTLNLVNTNGSSVSEFLYAFGNITVKGPSIIADMKNMDDYSHVMTAYGFSVTENKQMGLITVANGMLEIKNVSSKVSPFYGYNGLKLGAEVDIIAGKSKQAASIVAMDNFWTFEDWGVVVGPDPKYSYINISNTIRPPDKVNISSVTSRTEGKAVVKLKKVAGASGYEILYSTKATFTSAATKKVVTSGLTKTLTKLGKGKTYYIKVRAYKVNLAGQYVYGPYSGTKKVVVKK